MNLRDNKNIIKLLEDFNYKSNPEIIKKICNLIRKDIINNGDRSFSKNYNIDDINLDLVIDFSLNSKHPYYSNVNIYDIINGVEPVLLRIIVVDETIDVDYLMSVISHEIRHIWDVYTVSSDYEIDDFKKSIAITKFKKTGKMSKFINLVYLSLEHELIARHNMIYEMFRWKNIVDKEKLVDLFEKSYINQALQQLKSFSYLEILNEPDLYNFTIEFSKNIGDNFDGDLQKYYLNWEFLFKQKSDLFLSYVDSMIDDVISDIKNNKIYERNNIGFISYNESIGGNYLKTIFNKKV
jgi:hypothetical protein